MNNVEIQWPSGLKQEFPDLAGDNSYEIKEGEKPRVISVFPVR
jgi:hypothetical protein